jgi:hypothetical protein
VGRPATAEDFHGGELYTNYRRYPFFAERAAVIRQRFPSASSVLVAGCAKGYLVDELRSRGVNAWGCDLSVWARGEAQQVIPTNALFILEGDCTIAVSMTAVRTLALGGPVSRRFGVCVTEDLFPVLTDAEITSALSALRAVSQQMFHIITPGDPSDPKKVSSMNWKPITAWRALCAPDLVMDAETGTVA